MKNKILVSVLIIIIIVLGFVLLFKNSKNAVAPTLPPADSQNNVVNNPVQNIPANNVVKDNTVKNVVSDCMPTTAPWIKVLSPNGGETYTTSQNITIKWKTCNVSSSVHLNAQLVDVNNLSGGKALLCEGGSNTWGPECLNDGEQALGSGWDAGTYKINIASNEGVFVQDSSDRVFTINSVSSENSTSEVFNNQPGDIKSIKANGTNQWILAVDLLSRNTKWIPGVDSSGGFFINQNTKIRNLNVTANTKTYNCGAGPDGNETSPDILVSNSSFINNISSSNYKVRYFDINGTNITAMYEQCLP